MTMQIMIIKLNQILITINIMKNCSSGEISSNDIKTIRQ